MADVQFGTRVHMQLVHCMLQGAHQLRAEHMQQVLRFQTPDNYFFLTWHHKMGFVLVIQMEKKNTQLLMTTPIYRAYTAL